MVEYPMENEGWYREEPKAEDPKKEVVPIGGNTPGQLPPSVQGTPQDPSYKPKE